MKLRRLLGAFLIICILLSATAYAKPVYLTRGEVADYLLSAADFYNPGVVREDIIRGYEDGLLHEEKNVTRAEALVMLGRAFGKLPTPKGHNKRVALTAKDFNDVPQWATEELKNVFNSGIVAGTDKKVFSPDENITDVQMELFVKRVYSLYGENPCDDFYATANKEILEKMTLDSGQYASGTLSIVQETSTQRLSAIISQIVHSNHEYGTPKQKIADLYECFMDTRSINKTSVEPIRSYLNEIDSVKNIGELSGIQELLSKELVAGPFISLGLTVDLEDSKSYMMYFNTFTPLMNKEFYQENDETAHNAYRKYLKTLLVVSGENETVAEAKAESYISFERVMAESMLSTEDRSSVEKINNVYKFNKLEALFPDCDFNSELKSKSLVKEDRVLVQDAGLMEKFSEMYNQSNIDVLKTVAKIHLMNVWGAMLDERIVRAEEDLENAIFGTSGYYSRSQLAEILVQDVMPDYIGEIYVEKYFDEKSRQDVMNMALDIRNVFKERIEKLEWMSDETKARAIKKLDCMQIKIGYPDNFETFIDDVEIVPLEKGGTLFTNMLAITKASTKNVGTLQFMERDNSVWPLAPFVVNAGYDATSNSMIFPAAILQPPIYDRDVSYEENLGSIGYIIAHEMTHAFDSNGALFDENGNMCTWWNEEDYAAFEKLCADVVAFYDGYEAIPAMQTNGILTLSENVSDMGGAACIIELAGKKDNIDYKAVFNSMANTFAGTSTREYARYLIQNDNHADYKTRINCVVVHIDEFYETFGVKEGDGMYIPPEERITIW